LKDEGLSALLKGLAQMSRGLCLVTTRYRIKDIEAYTTAAPQRDLAPLSKEAGTRLLETLDVNGSQAEREKLSEDVRGHALSINLVASYLKKFFLGDIRKRDRIALGRANQTFRGGYAFRAMDAYVRELESEEGEAGPRALALLRSLGLFDRPADMKCLAALWRLPAINGLTEPLADLSEEERNEVFTGLADAKLLTMNLAASGEVASLDAHPLLREYFANALREKRPDAWRAAHKRLYQHLTATTPDKPAPTLEDMQPLYQAVAHGCQRGCTRRRARTSIATASCAGRIRTGFTALSSSALLAPTLAPSPVSSTRPGAGSQPISPHPPRHGR
jgi:hypothetical protein